ncbi:type II toxin-antitoxin system PemK/MazF family toxin [Companilactobacillus keshanensis]|uniref:Type II toxin-antitoxin system PemK/MazF family toxin n=1 Tax=Companilactobacillus keshanensis TaxID=2486003 RepID=A0ABW4BVY3_9LACO|nr:type II toxin-antitoxin system PemK/MazF family toxin [Companilactobacillus keshanensis]
MIEQGAIIYIDFEPHSGHEMGGHDSKNGNIRRPMVVISNNRYNDQTGLVLGMGVTSNSKMLENNNLFVPFADQISGVKGMISTINFSCFDFDTRNGKVVGKVSEIVLNKLLKNANFILSNK